MSLKMDEITHLKSSQLRYDICLLATATSDQIVKPGPEPACESARSH